MESATHREEILSGMFTEVGVGVAPGVHGEWWVAQVFRRPMPVPIARVAPAAAAAPARASADLRPPRATRARGSAAAVPAAIGTGDLGPDLEALRGALSPAPSASSALTLPGSPALIRAERDPRPARRVSAPVGLAASMLLLVVVGLTATVARERQRPSDAALRQRSHASMNWSRSPSSTAWTLPVS
jgi:hypothetical protein